MSSGCPSQRALEEFALRGERSDPVSEHIAVCAVCRSEVDEIRSNERFLRDAATLLARPAGASSSIPAAPVSAVEGFELIEEISRGGQGVVYRAVQSLTNRPAAVKMLLDGSFSSPRQLRRFEREIEIAARLRHPNVVTVFESGVSHDGRRFVAMEFVPGEPLDKHLDTKYPALGRSRTQAAMQLISQVAAGVGHAHSVGVIHRDLKPSNILVDADGIPRVLDFGLARPIDRVIDGSLTREFAGTPAYAAPEQFAGDGTGVGTAADVYALGLILYNAITGRHPYPRDGSFAELARHATSTAPVPPSLHVPRLPSDVEIIVLKALAKEPARRYRSAGELAADIDDYLADRPISARRDSAIYVLRRLALRHRAAALAALLTLTTILVAAVSLAILAENLDEQRRAALVALSDSRILHARLLSAAGEAARAEQTLWTEALALGLRSHTPELCFESDPRQRRLAWALVEYYSRMPRALRVRADSVPDQVHFDHGGSTISAIGQDGTVETWSLDGRPTRVIPTAWERPANPPSRSRLTRDGTRGVTLGNDGVHLVDTHSGAVLASFTNHDDPPLLAQFLPDGSAIILMHRSGATRALDGATLAQLAVLDTRTRVRNVTISSDGRTLAVVCDGPPHAHIRLWSTTEWTELPDVYSRSEPVSGIAPGRDWTSVLQNAEVSRDRQWLAAGLVGTVSVWRRDQPDRPTNLLAHSAPVQFTAFSPDSSLLITASTDGEVRAWTIPQCESLQHWANGARVCSVDVRPDLGLLAVGDFAGLVSVYELDRQPYVKTAPISARGLMGLAASHDGRHFAWGGLDGELTIYDANSESVRSQLKAHEGLITSICFSHDGSECFTTGLDGALRGWNIATGTLRRTLAEGLPDPWSVCASAHGRFIAVAGAGGVIRLWNTATDTSRELATPSNARTPALAFSPDGSLLAAVSVDTTATLWDTSTGAVRHQLLGHAREVRAVAFDPSGRIVATGADDRTIRIWDVRSGRHLRTIAGLPRDPFELAFDRTGLVLYCVGRGPALLVFDPLTGQELASLVAHERSVFRVCVSPDGRTVLTGGDDPWVSIWNLDHLRSYVRGNALRWEMDLAGRAGPQTDAGNQSE